MFYKIVQLAKYNIQLLTYVAFAFRAVFILAIPNLSQDFYRFIWDGQLLLKGLNPYLSTPFHEMNQGILSGFPNQVELYQGMGDLNASHYSNYPPLNQILFAWGNLFPGKSILSSVIGLRLVIVAADFGTLYFGKKLLERLNIPIYTIFWYILNPFIIIELTGNLHFEGVMIFFLVWSLYLLHIGKWQWSAVVFALSVSVKLIPLIFLPLLYQWFVKNNIIANKLKRSSQNEEIASSLTPRNDQKDVISIEQSQEKFNDEILNQVRNNKNSSSEPVLSEVEVLGMRRLISYYAIVGSVTVILFLPFYSQEFVSNYTETVCALVPEF